MAKGMQGSSRLLQVTDDQLPTVSVVTIESDARGGLLALDDVV